MQRTGGCNKSEIKYYNNPNGLCKLEQNHGEIGLTGPGDTCMTHCLERICGLYEICHLHSCLHDTFVRFYKKDQKGRGYCYALKYSSKHMETSLLLGHISGLIWSIKNRRH